MNSVRLSVEPLPPLGRLEKLWRELDDANGHSFFLTWTWIRTWLLARPSSVRPMLLKAWDSEDLVGLALLTFTTGRLYGLIPFRHVWLNATGNAKFDCIMIEHNGFACRGPRGGELLQVLAEAFSDGTIAGDELVLPGIASNFFIKPNLIDAGHLTGAFRAPLSGLSGENGIGQLLSSNARQQLRRSFRACERRGPLSLEVADDLSTALTFFDNLKALHIHSWERRGLRHAFSNSFFETFHRMLIANGIHDGNVDLIKVATGGRVLGYLYNFRHNGTVSSYQSGFDLSDPDLRPGYVCHALAMAHYAAKGMTDYDFLAGTNQLKQSYGSEHYDLFWRRLRRKTPVSRTETIARRVARLFSG